MNEQQQQDSEDWATDAEQQVRDVLGSYRSELRDRPGDEDLISTRQIDSLTFVSILTGLIDRSGRDVDLDAIGGTELRTITGLARVFFGPAGDQAPAGDRARPANQAPAANRAPAGDEVPGANQAPAGDEAVLGR